MTFPWRAKVGDRAGESLFIVFEGIDGSGKSTQARMLTDRLKAQGIRALPTAEPTFGPFGMIIRGLKRRPSPEEEARLFAQDREQHVEEIILPALESGVTVVCDRYVYSSAAYQGARGLDPELVFELNAAFALAPDIIFLIHVPVDIAMNRIISERGAGTTIFESEKDLRAVAALYDRIDDPLVETIDGTASPERIHEEITALVQRLPGFPRQV